MKTAEQLREALYMLDYQAINDSTEDDITSIIESDNDWMHPAHYILIGIGSLRSQSSVAITESELQDKAYQCIKILTQKYPPFLELIDTTGNTLSILYSSQDITAKEAVIKLLLDPEVGISRHVLHSKNYQADPSLTKYSLAGLVSKDGDFILPRITSLEVFERFETLDISNIVGSNGKTILHHEFALSSFDVFKALVEMGAELVPDSEGKTPYDIAKETNQKEIVEFVEERVSKNFVDGVIISGDKRSTLYTFYETLIRLSSQKVLEIMAVHGFDAFITATGGDATAYLSILLKRDVYHEAMLQTLLIVNGANVNAQSEDGKTPLHYAADYDNTEFGKFLIANGADVNAKNNKGETPLHIAAEYHTEFLKLLIQNGADVNAKNNGGQTALDSAFTAFLAEPKPQSAMLLIEKGMDVDSKNKDGFTPLHWAAYNDYTELAKLLIEKGADLNKQDKYGFTPLNRALQCGHAEIADLLREAEKESAKTHAQKVTKKRAASSSSIEK